ncbi:MAG: metallophosphoesterase [Clostridia bacterium]|nr:metallophosphoesterase [Clostridia bacterium]
MIPALIVIGILLLLYVAFFFENRRFIVRRETIKHAKIKEPFTVVQVSDLHDRRFGKEQEKLLSAIHDAKPDLILITGDLFNRHRESACENAFSFIRGAVGIAPVYFSEGNHECSLGETGERYIETICEMGVRVLRDEYADTGSVRIIGLRQYASPQQLSVLTDESRLNLVLAHRPELYPIYADTGADVILSGHAHGGQIRIFGRGVYAPQQGLFPQFDVGQYRIGRSILHVSRGLGNTIPFPRVFNTPELNVLIFKPITEKEHSNVC